MKLTSKKIDWHGMPNKREKIIFAVLLIAAFIVFIVRFWTPSRRSFVDMKVQLGEVIAEESELKRSLDAAMAAPQGKRRASGASSAEYNEWAEKVVEMPEVFLMQTITDPSILKGLEMPSIAFEDTRREGGVVVQPFKIGLNGSFIAVNGYIDRLYDLPLLLVIDSVDVNLDNTVSGRVNANIKGVVYGWK